MQLELPRGDRSTPVEQGPAVRAAIGRVGASTPNDQELAHMSTTNLFPLYTSANAPIGSQPVLAAAEKALGFLPNLYATVGGSAEALNGYHALDTILGKGTFTAAERQLIAVATSATNGCGYCTAAHSTFATSMHAAPDAVAAARGAGHSADPRTEALIAFTHAVTRDRGHIADGELERFLAAGFTGAQAMEVAANVGLKTISNYIDGFAPLPLDRQFEPQRWEQAPDSALSAVS
jgi:uncharacterized peroxidase-related enzyme